MDGDLKEIEIVQYVDLNKNGVLVARGWLLGRQLFLLAISNTHPIACSWGLQKSRRRKVIRGTSAVLLPLNGPLSSGYASTRAFLNPRIGGRQEFHQSRLLSGWARHPEEGTSPLEGSSLFLKLSSFSGGQAWKAGAGGRSRCDHGSHGPFLLD